MTQPSPEIAAAVEDLSHCCGRVAAECEANPGPMCGGSFFANQQTFTPNVYADAERARLRAAVLALAGDSYVVGVSAVLALFEVTE